MGVGRLTAHSLHWEESATLRGGNDAESARNMKNDEILMVVIAGSKELVKRYRKEHAAEHLVEVLDSFRKEASK